MASKPKSIAGSPWSEEEVQVLLSNSDASKSAIQYLLKQAGYNRSLRAIKCKKEKLGKSAVFHFENVPPPVKRKIKWVSGELPLTEEVTRFVTLNDVHVPHNIDLTTVFEFIKDFKPHYVLLNGDIINNDPFSHWDKKSPLRFKEMPQPKAYYDLCNEVFYRPLRETVGNKCKIVHGIGNHEYWSNKAIAEMPEGQGYWEVENNIEGIDAWYASKDMVNLGKLYFVHGDIINGGRNHATKMLNYFRRNLRYGHYHDIQEVSYHSPIDVTDRQTARSCGTLEKFNPGFMGNRPHDWIHAFTYGSVRKDGTFHDHTTMIVDGKFMANGRLYG